MENIDHTFLSASIFFSIKIFSICKAIVFWVETLILEKC